MCYLIAKINPPLFLNLHYRLFLYTFQGTRVQFHVLMRIYSVKPLRLLFWFLNYFTDILRIPDLKFLTTY